MSGTQRMASLENEKTHISWSMVRGEPISINEVTDTAIVGSVTLSHELAEEFVVCWIRLNGMPGTLISSPFTSDNE